MNSKPASLLSRVPTRGRWLLAALAAAALGYACARSTQEIKAKGVSETTVTASRPIKFKATGPMTFPANYPAIGGMKLEEGQTIDVNLAAGGSVKLKDRVEIDGTNVIIGPADKSGAEAASSLSFRTTLAVGSTSTYTWSVPELFGDAEAVVHVTGSWTAEGPLSALVDDGAGHFTLLPQLLTGFSYAVSGGPAVFRAPMDTPFGRIEGTGTIATTTGMSYGFAGDRSAISGQGSQGYVDPNGQSYDFGYAGAFPVRLDAGGGTALGTTTVAGGFDALDVPDPQPTPLPSPWPTAWPSPLARP